MYRLHHISDARSQQLLGWLAQQGLALEGCTTETPYALVDGTGVGYALPFHAQYRRGREIRKLRSHVKVVAVGYWQGGRVWLVGVQLGKAYADEGKLLGEWVLQHGLGGLPDSTLLVGDKLYGYRARLLEQLEGSGWLPVMRVEDGLRQRVRSGSGLRARARAQQYAEVLDGRYRIEQVFGSVKGVYGSYVGSVSWLGARSWAWGMWVLWNMVGVAQLLGGEVVFRLVLCLVKGIFERPHTIEELSFVILCTNIFYGATTRCGTQSAIAHGAKRASPTRSRTHPICIFATLRKPTFAKPLVLNIIRTSGTLG